MTGALAITWFDHRRTRELCSGLGIELALIETDYRGTRRYLLLSARTILLLARRRPTVLLVQSPSLVLSMLSVVLRKVFRYRLIVDAHNEAVVPYENRQEWIARVSRWVVRHAELTIVTNRQLAEIVREQGGRPLVLPDRVPAPAAGVVRDLGAKVNVVLIATFAKDEPIAEIFAAVQGTELELFVTGNSRKLRADVAAAAPSNVQFTGFLADEDYWSLLRAADALVDLTLKPDCLVCGAYEALAVGKPVLLSRNPAGVELFGDCAVFTDNTAADIRRALNSLVSERSRLQAAVLIKRNELAADWTLRAGRLAELMQRWCSGIQPGNIL